MTKQTFKAWVCWLNCEVQTQTPVQSIKQWICWEEQIICMFDTSGIYECNCLFKLKSGWVNDKLVRYNHTYMCGAAARSANSYAMKYNVEFVCFHRTYTHKVWPFHEPCTQVFKGIYVQIQILQSSFQITESLSLRRNNNYSLRRDAINFS